MPIIGVPPDNANFVLNDSAFDFNGNFGFGNPLQSGRGQASSDNDIRHRFALNPPEIPAAPLKGVSGAASGDGR
jgi:hypothetical protein